MKWLKTAGTWAKLLAAAAVFALLAIFRPRRDWKKIADDNEAADVQDDINLANRANQEAAAHDRRAHEVRAEAEKAKPDESISDIVDRWRRG